jgi:hypothetical protein
MLDISNIPNQSDNVWIYYSQGETAWQTWTKPKRCNFIWIMCIGGGSGGFGGSGAGAAPNSNAGGSGAVTRAMFYSYTLPDTLYIQPGTGSIGGAGAATNINNVSATPGRSWVTLIPSTTQPVAMNTVCVSGTTPATNTGESVATPTVASLLNLATFVSTAGQNSGTTPLTSNIVSAGSVGSSAQATAGTTISGINLGFHTTPTITGGSTAGGNGLPGVWSWKPIIYGIGGSGGGGNAAGTGGNGGNGAYGCGGGGGGMGNGLGGNGGRGGDGLVIISTF